MATPYIGEIRLVPFNFAPLDWHFCDGSILPIAEYEALFSLVGTTYGGNGTTNFALPDLRSRVAMHQGQGYVMGQHSGTETVTITSTNLPEHSHQLNVSSGLGNKLSPQQNFLAASPDGLGYVYQPFNAGDAEAMGTGALTTFPGGNLPHANIQPYLALNYIIALFGIYPPQN